MVPTVAVVGAGGPTGLQCVKRLAEATDWRIRAVARSRTKHEAALLQAAGPTAASRLEIVGADMTLPDTLPAAVAGAAYVICAAGGQGFLSAEAVDNIGVGNLVAAVKAAGSCQRFVLVSGVCTHPCNRWHPARMVLNTFVRWRTLEQKFAGEERLRSSGIPYTIIKPPILINEPAGRFVLHMGLDTTWDCAIGRGTGPYTVSRADVAAVCVEALKRPAAANKSLTVYTKRVKMAVQPLSQGDGALDAELRRVFDSVAA